MARGAQGPPPLRPFGLLLHHDGSWSHDGQPIANRRLRAAFDRGVCFLPAEGRDGKGVFAVKVGHFRGQIEVEEAAFFVRDFEAETGAISLSDGSIEPLDVASLRSSPRDAALLCRVKRELDPAGLLARFGLAAQAELLHAVEDAGDGPTLCIAGVPRRLPEL
ncbi:MAG: hypothetical protein JRE43_05120 [Deltaproteobacteria bacterium]|nr:hypothetical protein [Deltaproteobacteria bacterium]MBW2542983.1 hypothetical protein [Deltaproteobacteria bacterium]